MSIASVMLSNHFILYCPLLLLLSIFPSIKFFSSESAFRIRWPNIGSSVSVLPMNIQGWFLLGLTGLISLQSKELSRVFFSTIRKHQFFHAQSSANKDSFTFSFPIWIHIISFSFLITLSRSSKTMLNISSESENLYAVPDIKWNAFSFLPLRMVFSVCLLYMAFIRLR